MVTWFGQYAPIRDRFRALQLVHAGLAATSLGASAAAAHGFGAALPIAISALCLVATILDDR